MKYTVNMGAYALGSSWFVELFYQEVPKVYNIQVTFNAGNILKLNIYNNVLELAEFN